MDHPRLPSLKTAIVLTNLGTPQAPTSLALLRYLNEFLSDPRVVEIPALLWQPLLKSIILPIRSPQSARLYQRIWQPQGSPLLTYSQQLVQQLNASIQKDDTQVFLAMRYGQPSLKALLHQLRHAGLKKLIVVPMYPQYASATTGSALDVVHQSLMKYRYQPSLHTLGSYHDHPAYINALAQSVRQSWQQKGRGEKLLISFHGLPKRSLNLGDPYACLCQKTARLLAETLDLAKDSYQIVFQSRFGKARWLEPYCHTTLLSAAQAGIKTIDIICPGFAVDCLETLEEIAIRNQTAFQQAGGQHLNYIPCLNASEAQVALYRELISPYLGE